MKEILIVKRKEWWDWLKANHNKESGIWLIYYKKHTGKERLAYENAVNEALCFGWIDGQIKRIDEDRYKQKFTPRSERSGWSLINKKRALKLIKEKSMTKAGLVKVEAAKKSGKWNAAYTTAKPVVMPKELAKELNKSVKAKTNFKNFPPSAKNTYINWLNSAKKEETRKLRLKKIFQFAKDNQKPTM